MNLSTSQANVIAVCRSAAHTFSKPPGLAIRLIAGLGVEGDAHMGETVKHRSRVAKDPLAANLRQVHLIHGELFEELRRAGFEVAPGDMGENITTSGIDLLGLAEGTILKIGVQARIRLTGLRNPCQQIDRYQPGLMQAVLDRDAAGNLIRKSGVMAVVETGGEVAAGDPILVELAPTPHRALEPV